MCFSASASFITAGVTAVAGIVALTRVNQARELPLAATPLLFAVQQGVEGIMWLDIPSAPGGTASTGLTLLYLFLANAFWPVYAPMAALLVEPSKARRRLMFVWLAVGAGVGVHLFWRLLGHPAGALIVDGHIVYVAGPGTSTAVAIAYVAAVCAPPLLSSHRAIVALGTIVLTGAVLAHAVYSAAFLSTWCFFAAVASVVILFHFERVRRLRLRTAGV